MASTGFIFEKPEESPGFLLWQVTNLWQREIKKALQPYNLTHTQFVLLANIYWLQTQQQEVTQIILSTQTHIDPMTTSAVLRTLQQKGLIERKEHTTDTRAKTVVMTKQGKVTTKKALVTIEQFDQQFFTLPGKDLSNLTKNLQALLLPSTSL